MNKYSKRKSIKATLLPFPKYKTMNHTYLKIVRYSRLYSGQLSSAVTISLILDESTWVLSGWLPSMLWKTWVVVSWLFARQVPLSSVNWKWKLGNNVNSLYFFKEESLMPLHSLSKLHKCQVWVILKPKLHMPEKFIY